MKKRTSIFEKLAHNASIFTGSTPAFTIALLAVILWLLIGKIFNYSDTWQLAINTGTTIITFLMVLLIQRSQNKDSRAVHLKLNELVAALEGPSNRLIDIEELTEAELEALSVYYRKLAEMARTEKRLSGSHSIEKALEKHQLKYHDTIRPKKNENQ